MAWSSMGISYKESSELCLPEVLNEKKKKKDIRISIHLYPKKEIKFSCSDDLLHSSENKLCLCVYVL